MMQHRALVTDDDLHASLAAVSKIGSPIPHSVSLPCDAEDSSISGVRPPQSRAGAAVGFDSVHQEALTAERTLTARTALSVGEGR